MMVDPCEAGKIPPLAATASDITRLPERIAIPPPEAFLIGRLCGYPKPGSVDTIMAIRTCATAPAKPHHPYS